MAPSRIAAVGSQVEPSIQGTTRSVQKNTTMARCVEAGAVGDFKAQEEALDLFTCVSYKCLVIVGTPPLFSAYRPS